MKIGITFPSGGPGFCADHVVTLAQNAEAMGFASLWTYDRVYYPNAPKNGYQGHIHPWPEHFKYAVDPLDTLSFLAAETSKITLGTNILNVPYYNPILLARRITTIDILSKGRLALGIGLGWSEDEYEAAGVAWAKRGKRLNEQLTLMKAIWANEDCAFDGEFYQLSAGKFMTKPVQKPHPPIYIGTFSVPGLKRVVELADGWTPAALGAEQIAQLGGKMREIATQMGRAPESLKTILRAGSVNVSAEIGGDRDALHGSVTQIKADLDVLKDVGVNELIVPIATPQGATDDDLSPVLHQMGQIAQLAS